MARTPVRTNALTDLSMQAGRSKMGAEGGLAKAARFAVVINLPQWATTNPLLPSQAQGSTQWGGFNGDLVYLCEAAEMPGRGFMSLDVRYYGPNQKLPFQSQYEDVTLTFLCRSESRERQFFDDWMEVINPTNSFDFSFRSEYETTVEIRQLAEYGTGSAPKETYRITLFNAYPTNINPQPMTWADDQYQRLAVTFTYVKWARIGLDGAPRSANDLVSGRDQINNGIRTIITPVQ
jgi:hypothetical protein